MPRVTGYSSTQAAIAAARKLANRTGRPVTVLVRNPYDAATGSGKRSRHERLGPAIAEAKAISRGRGGVGFVSWVSGQKGGHRIPMMTFEGGRIEHYDPDMLTIRRQIDRTERKRKRNPTGIPFSYTFADTEEELESTGKFRPVVRGRDGRRHRPAIKIPRDDLAAFAEGYEEIRREAGAYRSARQRNPEKDTAEWIAEMQAAGWKDPASRDLPAVPAPRERKATPPGLLAVQAAPTAAGKGRAVRKPAQGSLFTEEEAGGPQRDLFPRRRNPGDAWHTDYAAHVGSAPKTFRSTRSVIAAIRAGGAPAAGDLVTEDAARVFWHTPADGVPRVTVATGAGSWTRKIGPRPRRNPRRVLVPPATVDAQLAARDYWASQGDWRPGGGGTETPFTTRTGRRLLYVWQPRTGRHAYLDTGTDMILTDAEADAALAKNPIATRKLHEKLSRLQLAAGKAWHRGSPASVRRSRKLQAAADRYFRLIYGASFRVDRPRKRNPLREVPPDSLEAALAHVRRGGRLIVPTYTRVYTIDARTLDRWAKVPGAPLLRAEGKGYRLRVGRSSIFILPGQLKYAENPTWTMGTPTRPGPGGSTMRKFYDHAGKLRGEQFDTGEVSRLLIHSNPPAV